VDAKTHWENVYTTKEPEAVSWYRAHLETSLALIERAAHSRSASIIDIGANWTDWESCWRVPATQNSAKENGSNKNQQYARERFVRRPLIPLACRLYVTGQTRVQLAVFNA